MAKTKVKKMAFGGYSGIGNAMPPQGRPAMPPQGGRGISPNPGRPVMPNPGGTAPVAQDIKSALANPQMAQNIGAALGNALNQSKPGTGSTLEQMPQGMPPPPGMPPKMMGGMGGMGASGMGSGMGGVGGPSGGGMGVGGSGVGGSGVGGVGGGMAKGGMTASSRGDGIATKGKTKGKFV